MMLSALNVRGTIPHWGDFMPVFLKLMNTKVVGCLRTPATGNRVPPLCNRLCAFVVARRCRVAGLRPLCRV